MRGSLILPTHLLFLVFFVSLWKSRSPFVTILLPSEGRCIVIIIQSFTIKLKWPIETNSTETVLPPLIKTGVAGVGDNTHLTF